MQNTVYLTRDNPVVIEFQFLDGDFVTDGLNNFTDIHVTIGNETYTLLSNPANVIVSSDTQLRIAIGDTTSLIDGAYYMSIIGISDTYDDGYVLSQDSDLPRVIVKTI